MRKIAWSIVGVLPLAAAAHANPRFIASFDSGFTADFALGNPVPVSIGNSVIDTVIKQYGDGSLDPSANLPGGNRLAYETSGNFVMGANTAGTVEMWVKTSWMGDTRQVLFSMYQPDFVGTVQLELMNNGTVRAVLDTFNSGGGVWFQQFGGGGLIDGEFHHIAWNWDLSAANPEERYSTLFLDGEPQSFAGFGTLQYPGTVGETFEIGSHQGGWDALQGRIDDFRFSDNAVYGQAGFIPPGPFIITPTWSATGGGNWSDSGNWQDGNVPNAIGATAVFGPAISAPATVTVDIPVTVGTLRFNNPDAFTLAGSNTLTMQATAGQAQVNVISGSHTISAPLALASDTTFTVTNSTDVLTVNNLQSAIGRNITKAGSGTMRVNRVVADHLTVSGGSVAMLPNGTASGTSNVKELTIAGGASPTARIDLADNALVVDYTPADAEPFDTIRAQIFSAYDGGSWDGDGIGSSLANASTHGIGYAEAVSLASVPAIFGSVDNTAVLVRYTRYGDANLDGQVNLADFNRLAANFGASGASWDQGDFTYDGMVNLADFNRLAANFGLQASLDGPTPDDWSALAAAVPEPSLASLLLCGSALLVRRRRR